MATLDIPTITVTGVPIKPLTTTATATQGDVGWLDKIFGTLISGGSAYMDFELQKKTLETQLKLQQQYGALYSTPGAQFPNAPMQYQQAGGGGLILLLMVGMGLFILAKE